MVDVCKPLWVYADFAAYKSKQFMQISKSVSTKSEAQNNLSERLNNFDRWEDRKVSTIFFHQGLTVLTRFFKKQLPVKMYFKW